MSLFWNVQWVFITGYFVSVLIHLTFTNNRHRPLYCSRMCFFYYYYLFFFVLAEKMPINMSSFLFIEVVIIAWLPAASFLLLLLNTPVIQSNMLTLCDIWIDLVWFRVYIRSGFIQCSINCWLISFARLCVLCVCGFIVVAGSIIWSHTSSMAIQRL